MKDDSRHRRTNLIIGLITIVIVFITCYFVIKSMNTNNVEAKNGKLNLTQIDLDKSGPLAINGQWEFYWNDFLYPEDFTKEPKADFTYENLPGCWTKYVDKTGQRLNSKGKATYRLKVEVPRGCNNLGIKLSNVWGKGRIFIKRDNDTLEELRGMREEHLENMLIKSKFFDVYGKSFDIIIQLENGEMIKSGITKSIYIGTEEEILKFRDRYLFIDMSSIAALFLFSIYFLCRTYQENCSKSSVQLAIYSFLALIFISLIDEMLILRIFPNLSMEDIYKMTTIDGIISSYVLLEYIDYSYNTKLPKKLIYGYGIVSVIYIGIIYTTNLPKIFDIGAFQATLGILAILYGSVVVIKGIVKKEQGSNFNIFLLISIVMITFAIIYNTFNTKQIKFLIPMYILVFILSQGMVLSYKYFSSIKVIEELSNKLVVLNKRKDEFLENTSYELKLPLKGICNISKSLLEGAAGQLNFEQKENIEIIEVATERLDILVDDILDYSNFTNGYVVTQNKAVNIKSVLLLVFNIVSYSIKDKPIVIENRIMGYEAIVMGDENRLKQVFYNLMDTMISFTETGKIILEARIVEENIEIFIENKNLYVEEDEDIFNSIDWINNVGKHSKKKKRSRIGLWVARETVRLHHGEVVFVSTEKKGTKFAVRLPIINSSIEEVSCDYEDSNDVKDLRLVKYEDTKGKTYKQSIMILEGNQVNRKVIENALKIEGYYTNSISSGRELLENLNEVIKDELCIINALLPNSSGYELVREIRKKYSNIDLPILMIVDRSYTHNVSLALYMGANDVLIEPYDVSELKARINTLIQLKKSVNALINSEMDFLKAQIKPHFIFNVLSVISSLITREPKNAKKLILDFSDYLRSSFDFSSGDNLTSIDKELELVRAYIAIEKARFKDRLNVSMFIEEDINIKIPPLVIQPIVENAIRHGILNKIEGGSIKIMIYKDEKEVVIIVKDDGIGIEAHRLSKLLNGKDERAGVGIANINNRLIKTYGYGLAITSNLGQGTEVTIRIPLK